MRPSRSLVLFSLLLLAPTACEYIAGTKSRKVSTAGTSGYDAGVDSAKLVANDAGASTGGSLGTDGPWSPADRPLSGPDVSTGGILGGGGAAGTSGIVTTGGAATGGLRTGGVTATAGLATGGVTAIGGGSAGVVGSGGVTETGGAGSGGVTRTGSTGGARSGGETQSGGARTGGAGAGGTATGGTGTGSTVSGKAAGVGCNGTGECQAGLTCLDKVCCKVASCGTCQQCTGVGGTCVAVTGADDPDTCMKDSTCNASGACKKKDGQPCTTASDCLTGSCNSSHVCGPITTSRCVGLAATCGPSGNGDCCASLPVTGGTFYRSYDGIDFPSTSDPATVADFYLDKYEITVGRFRQFVEAGKGTQVNPPAAGDGAHPLIAGSGWNAAWNTSLAANTAALTTRIKCETGQQTWTDTAGANESRPINCLDWYTAAAFCAWDGGRLATEAEWNYAAAGGNEQRYYPWSTTSTIIDDSYTVYCGGSCSSAQNVGSKSPKGDGKWGQSDLAGNVSEWTLDWYAAGYSNPCSNCAELTVAPNRTFRGGSYGGDASYLRSALRYWGTAEVRIAGIGARCARAGL